MTVFVIFMAVTTMLFPFCAVVWCTVVNGWGASFTLPEVVRFVAEVLSLLVLAASMAMVSVLVSVVTRSPAAAIAIPLGVTLLQVPVLNSASSFEAAHALPFGAMWYVADGAMSAGYGLALGAAWTAVLLMASVLVLWRADAE